MLHAQSGVKVSPSGFGFGVSYTDHKVVSSARLSILGSLLPLLLCSIVVAGFEQIFEQIG